MVKSKKPIEFFLNFWLGGWAVYSESNCTDLGPFRRYIRAGQKRVVFQRLFFSRNRKGGVMQILKRTKNIFIKIDDRREKIEDFIADEILTKLDESETVDSLEKKGIIAAITAANAYAATYGVPTIPEEIKERIAEGCVKAIGKANKKLQSQLKKKSKRYKERHKEESKNND